MSRTDLYIHLVMHWKGEEFDNMDVIAEHLMREYRALLPLSTELASANQEKRESILKSGDLVMIFMDILHEQKRLHDALAHYSRYAHDFSLSPRKEPLILKESKESIAGCCWLAHAERPGIMSANRRD